VRTLQLVAETRGVAELAGRVRAAGRMGLDTEFVRERTYRARLCLLQVATDDEIALVDPVSADVSEIARLVGAPEVEVVVHAGRQDLDILFDRYGTVPSRVYDVQIAAGFAGFGASLPYGRLVESVAGVTLTKGESYTDWCRRPLTPAQLTYAEEDVRFLLPVADRLKSELERRGRAAWALEEMRALEDEASYGVDPERAWRRIPGRGTLSPRQAAVLRRLAAWREDKAARRDIPRGWVVKDPTLGEIARRRPRTIAELKAIRGLNAREAERSGREILAEVAAAAGSSVSDLEAPAWPRAAVARARVVSGLADVVARARCERAGVAPELVVTRAEVETVLAELFSGALDENRHRLLRGWRRTLVGEHIVALARGETAVRATDAPPYVEEVRT